MAGVSLALRRTLSSQSYVGQTSGYVYAGLAMAGPSLMTALCMYAIHVSGLIEVADWRSFQNFILYGYCGSIVLVGVVQLVVARYVSDRLFVGDATSLVPTYVSSTLIALVLHAGVAGIFTAITQPPLLQGLAVMAFFGSLAMVWMGMVFVGAIRSFIFILCAFAVGTAVGLAGAMRLGPAYGLTGLLGSFAAGHAATAVLLAARLRAEFPASQPTDFGFLRTFLSHPRLALIGAIYASALWIDKIVFWLGPYAVQTGTGLRSFPLYDNAAFMAYLTAIPALALLFIRVEVSFHDKCRAFYAAVHEGANLALLRARRRELYESFGQSMIKIARLQGIVTLVAILLAPSLLEAAGLDWVQYYVFRILCVGTFLHLLVFALLLCAMHLACYREALTMVLTYLLACGFATEVTMALDASWFGYGHVFGGLAALAVGYPRIKDRVRYIDYYTFMRAQEV